MDSTDNQTPTRVYTDGSCLGNPGRGGWAYAVDSGPWASGYEESTTNQRMELQAAIEAVAAIDGPLTVVSDSSYVVKCFSDGWWKGWQRRGWKNSKGVAVANRDLWEPFIDTVNSRADVTFEWVKGHANSRMNDAADQLAVSAARTGTGRSGASFENSDLIAAAH